MDYQYLRLKGQRTTKNQYGLTNNNNNNNNNSDNKNFKLT